MDLGDHFGQVTLHVKESDLPTGKHKKIGSWREVVVGEKVWEKLTYMHENPVRAGLAAQACDWAFSSARYYEQGRSVGVPIR